MPRSLASLLSLKPVAFANFQTRVEAEKAMDDLQVRRGGAPNSAGYKVPEGCHLPPLQGISMRVTAIVSPSATTCCFIFHVSSDAASPVLRASSSTPTITNCSDLSLPEPTVEWHSENHRTCSQMEARMACVS